MVAVPEVGHHEEPLNWKFISIFFNFIHVHAHFIFHPINAYRKIPVRILFNMKPFVLVNFLFCMHYIQQFNFHYILTFNAFPLLLLYHHLCNKSQLDFAYRFRIKINYISSLL